MRPSVPPGSADSTLIERPVAAPPEGGPHRSPSRGAYLARRACRAHRQAVRAQIVYGLTIGWVLTLGGGFVYCCVPSPLDPLWAALTAVGAAHLAAAVLAPELLSIPQRLWARLAHVQGALVMKCLLTVIYFLLIWPAGWLTRRQHHGFVRWTDTPPEGTTAWQPVLEEVDQTPRGRSSASRSLLLLAIGVLAFFIRRGQYLLVPILILRLILGLVLYFVQTSALAPLIYTLF
jgi:hypothetical protein